MDSAANNLPTIPVRNLRDSEGENNLVLATLAAGSTCSTILGAAKRIRRNLPEDGHMFPPKTP